MSHLRFLLFLYFLLPTVVLAQIDTGAIVGTVTDQTGAVIPDVRITVTNKATAVAVAATTNAQGQYQVAALIPGTYLVKAEAPGMGAQNYDNIRIDVQSRPAIDFRLSVGSVQHVVTVDAVSPILQTRSERIQLGSAFAPQAGSSGLRAALRSGLSAGGSLGDARRFRHVLPAR